VTPGDLSDRAAQIVAAVSDDPQARYQLRVDFYTRYGFGPGAGYGTSELAFFQWEISRGVLNPLSSPNPGSPWWREVNGAFLYYGELAALVEQAGAPADSFPYPVECWLAYFHSPGSRTWYCAHNASIARGYVQCAAEAAQECRFEQDFMGEVLYRLLYAQAMVEDSTIFGRLGDFMARPESDAVRDLVHIPDFYPDHYPLTAQDIKHVLHHGYSLEEQVVDVLDRYLILPRIEVLFQRAAAWLNEPVLQTFVSSDCCVYPSLSSAATP
jgi:hypothetical protein